MLPSWVSKSKMAAPVLSMETLKNEELNIISHLMNICIMGRLEDDDTEPFKAFVGIFKHIYFGKAKVSPVCYVYAQLALALAYTR